MKKNIHPDNYRLVVFKDMSNGDTFITKSCAESKETIKIDGAEYPLIKREISSTSHPFYTGKMKLVDTAGRVDKFYKKFGKSAFASKSTNEEKLAAEPAAAESVAAESAAAEPAAAESAAAEPAAAESAAADSAAADSAAADSAAAEPAAAKSAAADSAAADSTTTEVPAVDPNTAN